LAKGLSRANAADDGARGSAKQDRGARGGDISHSPHVRNRWRKRPEGRRSRQAEAPPAQDVGESAEEDFRRPEKTLGQAEGEEVAPFLRSRIQADAPDVVVASVLPPRRQFPLNKKKRTRQCVDVAAGSDESPVILQEQGLFVLQGFAAILGSLTRDSQFRNTRRAGRRRIEGHGRQPGMRGCLSWSWVSCTGQDSMSSTIIEVLKYSRLQVGVCQTKAVRSVRPRTSPIREVHRPN
jgi:hypothetical protein